MDRLSPFLLYARTLLANLTQSWVGFKSLDLKALVSFAPAQNALIWRKMRWNAPQSTSPTLEGPLGRNLAESPGVRGS